MSEREVSPYQTPSAAPSAQTVMGLQGYREVAGVGKTCRALLIVCVVLSAVQVALDLWIAKQFAGGGLPIFDAEGNTTTLSQLYLQVVSTYTIVFLLTAIFFCSWTKRVVQNAWLASSMKGSQQMSMSPSWAVGFHFIPFANLWKPLEGMQQAWRVSFSDDSGRGLLMLWWLPWVGSTVIGAVSVMRSGAGTYEGNAADHMVYAGEMGLTLLSAIALSEVVRRLTKRQTEIISEEGV